MCAILCGGVAGSAATVCGRLTFGTELTVEGRSVGTLGSSAGRNGLAIARIDRVKAAMDDGKAIHAGDVAVTLSIPRWATFRFPEQAGAEEA